MKKVYLSVLILAVFICMVSSVSATVVQWTVASGGNGHWYERVGVSTNGINWDAANTQATGMGGYLVTITSPEENLFLTNEASLGGGINMNGLESLWTGGYQIIHDPAEPTIGNWAWKNGDSFGYTNWWVDSGGGEPSNGDGENYIIFQHGFLTDGKAWNDYSNVSAQGFVVEYDSNPNSPVPEPATLLLLGFGLLGVAGVSRRKN